jgi:hypothetical protein
MKTFKFNALFSALFAIIKPVQFNMAMLNYVPGSEEPQTFDDLPAGEYVAMIVASEERDTADRTGSFIALEHKIIEGQYNGRKLFNNLNLNNRSDTAVKIARGTLESICRAQGRIETVSDSSELHNIPMIVKVSYNTTRKNKAGVMEELKEGQRNSITAYKKYEGETGQFAPAQAAAAPITVATAAAPQPVATAAPAAPVGAAPWG